MSNRNKHADNRPMSILTPYARQTFRSSRRFWQLGYRRQTFQSFHQVLSEPFLPSSTTGRGRLSRLCLSRARTARRLVKLGFTCPAPGLGDRVADQRHLDAILLAWAAIG